MLLQFTVKNYMSIKEKQILSLEPSADKEHPENIIIQNQFKAQNFSAIYGANASGKTSLFKAMTMALIIIRTSNARQLNIPIPVVPFKFTDDCEKIPSEFEFTFIASDHKKYIYGFSATAEKVAEEYLYRYDTYQPKMVFERSASRSPEYEISRAEKTNLSPLVRMNTPNKLFLATATNWNAEATKVPYTWLSECIDTFTNSDELINYSMGKYAQENGAYIDFAKKLLHQADINISDIKVEQQENVTVQNPALNGVIIDNRIIPAVPQKTMKIITSHTVEDENHQEHQYRLLFQEESLGTQQLFFLAPMLKDTFDNGKVLFIDELDRSLHPFIVRFLVNLFRNADINKNGAQLIFTTHDTTLLSLSRMRRDQINFVEKDAKTGATVLYSLDDFSVRKTDNIEKGYLNGRYGAVPYPLTEEII